MRLVNVPGARRRNKYESNHELAVDRVEDEDVYVALRDAFDDMKRQLQDDVRRVRGQQKVHAVPLHGKVARLNPDEHFGFIEAADGNAYHFSPENLDGTTFGHLRLGTECSSFRRLPPRVGKPSG